MQFMWQNAAWVCKKLSRVLLLYPACNEAVINNMLVRKESSPLSIHLFIKIHYLFNQLNRSGHIRQCCGNQVWSIVKRCISSR
jgi:hypothetical protein